MKRDLIEEYIQSGGTIEVCPAINGNKERAIVNKRRKREMEEKEEKKKGPPIKPQDEICVLSHCMNLETCKHPCPTLTWVDGNAMTEEEIINDPSTERRAFRDYKAYISEQKENHDHILDSIMEVPDKKLRAIFALIQIGLSKKDISSLIHVSERHIRRILMSAIKDNKSYYKFKHI